MMMTTARILFHIYFVNAECLFTEQMCSKTFLWEYTHFKLRKSNCVVLKFCLFYMCVVGCEACIS